MPEGNTIHWLARVHTRDFGGRRVRVASPQGRFAREARRLDGRGFARAEAYGKHLFHHWEGGLVVHVHLGMAGWFYRHAAPAPAPRPTVRMRLSTRAVSTDLIGPPTCELIPEFARRALLERLGPDPLRRDFDPERARAFLAKRPRRAIGDALLDQRVLAGVGNIYRAEALFLCGVHPLRRSADVSPEEWERLWRTVRALMRRGAVRGRIRTVATDEPPAHPLSGRGADDAFYVYQQEVCRRCGGAVSEFPQSARRMFACPRCQPRRGTGRRGRASGKTRKRGAAAP
ncbi:MAG: Fpg/Nei family DNA glycosylase [Syntrophomonadaceae bacterium]